MRTDESQAVRFSSPAICLSGKEWLWTVGICLAVLVTVPSLWTMSDTFEPSPDYRLPYRLGYDYWHFRRYSHEAIERYDILMVGDSVLWGNYVPCDHTLTHYLNECAGREQFGNLSIHGIHPIALAGLLEYYGREITGKKVILHCNPLWLSSADADLQTEKETKINHAKLIPQWGSEVACYKEPAETRLRNTLERTIGFLQWRNHLQICCFDSMSLPQWSLEHPYQNPLGRITFDLPGPKHQPHSTHIRWDPNTKPQSELPWVELDTSLQWRFFQKTIATLQARENQVFVLVGPFNEHMLTPENVAVYRRIQACIENWLRENEIPYYMSTALPSEYYADASHPLAEGYALLAEQLYNHPLFRTVILDADAKILGKGNRSHDILKTRPRRWAGEIHLIFRNIVDNRSDAVNGSLIR